MRNYVTVFDQNFILQGLALYDSLVLHAGHFRLFVVAVDTTCFDLLTRLDLPHLIVLPLENYETQELRQAKKNRTHGEYCWTLASHSYSFVHQFDSSVSQITYIDTDVFLFNSPEPVFEELASSKKDILLTEHAFSEENDHSDVGSGRFCVQFMPVNCTRAGMEIISHWQKQCRKECPSKAKNGIFGDQAYLETWPERYTTSVHVFSQPGLCLAPWNAKRFLHSEAMVRHILYHFHGFRFISLKEVQAWFGYRLPDQVLPLYATYIESLEKQIERLRAIGVEKIPFLPPPERAESFLWLRRFKWRFFDKIVRILPIN